MNFSLHSIGYGNRSIEDLIGLLLQYHLEFLVDVRTRPWSKRFEDYRKENLQRHLQAAGITYVFLGEELGGMPTDPELRTAEGRVDYVKLAESDLYQQGLGRLRTAHQKAVRLGFMCAELRPEHCHRALLIGESLFEEGINVGHIDHDGEVRSHADVRHRWLDGRKLELF